MRLTRRDVLYNASLALAGAGLTSTGCTRLRSRTSRAPLRIGLVTDVHYADKQTAGNRHYRDSLAKLASAITRFNQEQVDFVVELGDLVDAAASVDEELGYLRSIQAVYEKARCPSHYVLGNHCVDTLTKEQFLQTCGAPCSRYSFDVAGFHFVILDACFRQDGRPYGNKNSHWTDANIPGGELDWLQGDLNATRRPVVVFVHQRLDVDGPHGIKNGVEVRRVLESSGKVSAVFQGHHHRNDLEGINGIQYCTLAAMVEGPGPDHNAYAIATLYPNGAIRLDGFGQQASHHIVPVTPAQVCLTAV